MLLYGNAWRKDPFRSLVNFNFSGDHALARLSQSGEVAVTVSDPWDSEIASARLEPQFARAFHGGASAIAGLEFMEERFVLGYCSLTIERSLGPVLHLGVWLRRWKTDITRMDSDPSSATVRSMTLSTSVRRVTSQGIDSARL